MRVTGKPFISVEQLLAGEIPKMPPVLTPYLRAKKQKKAPAEQMAFGGDS